MRRIALMVSPVLVLLTLASPAVAAAGDRLQAQFTQHFGRGVGADSGPCVVGFCGSGLVVGYGQAELTLIATSVVPTSADGCGSALAVGGTATVELQDGSVLLLNEAGIYCLPGESHLAPGNFFVSYGNPVEVDATYTIVGGSGVFVGAAGSGTTAIHQAGDTQTATYSGTLTIG